MPVGDAEALSELRQGSVLEKTRFHARHAGRIWEVDVYAGDNEGLVIAEVELESEIAPTSTCRPGSGARSPDEACYYAARLAMRPYRSWPDAAAAGTGSA